jgi:alanine racemase
MMSNPIPNPHGALLTIDTNALVANWKLLSERAKPAECGAVVKADAYGLGIEPVVQALMKAGCRTFFLAHLGEAQEARKAAPLSHIYVLNGMPPGSEELYRQYRLRPVLGSIAEVGRWRKAGGGPSALHIDTGMNRLGLTIDEAKMLSQHDAWRSVGFELLMSHLVSSEEEKSKLNEAQITRFDRVSAWFGGGIKKRSLANSSAHFLPQNPHYDLTRPGYALYGGNPTPGQPNPMSQVVRLEAPIIQTRPVETGDHVGYNAQWTAKRPSQIATISIGYADGWLRSLSTTDGKLGGHAIVNGVLCPFAGRISMDLITIDITDCPEGSVKAGHKAVLIGDGITVDDVAVMAGTNGYEILTSLSARYQRKVI